MGDWLLNLPVLGMGALLSGETEAHLRRLIRAYIQEAVTEEWPSMARQAEPIVDNRVKWTVLLVQAGSLRSRSEWFTAITAPPTASS
jgi:hypothetical protein